MWFLFNVPITKRRAVSNGTNVPFAPSTGTNVTNRRWRGSEERKLTIGSTNFIGYSSGRAAASDFGGAGGVRTDGLPAARTRTKIGLLESFEAQTLGPSPPRGLTT